MLESSSNIPNLFHFSKELGWPERGYASYVGAKTREQWNDRIRGTSN